MWSVWRGSRVNCETYLNECSFLKIIRQRHYDMNDLNQLFKTVSTKRIHDFVKDIGLYTSL